MRRLPSPAMVIACLALVVALSGAGYAAVKLPRNSVGYQQIKTGAVRSAEIKDNAVLGRDVKESSLAKVPNADKLDGKDWSLLGSSARYAGIEFIPRDSTMELTYTSTGGVRLADSTSNDFAAVPVDLPQGVKVTTVTLYVIDNDPADMTFVFLAYGPTASGIPLEEFEVSGTSGATGFQEVVIPVDPLVTIDNSSRSYHLLVNFGAATSSLVLYGAKVDYTLN